MSEVESECLECAGVYERLQKKHRKLKKKCRKMQKSFAAVECAVLHKCKRREEFIIGECEAYRGKYEAGC